MVEQIEKVDLYVNKYTPIRGNTYTKLHHSQCKKNKDNKCFQWSVLAGLHPVDKNRQRVSKYKEYESELDFTGISCPVSLADIPKFEQQNNLGINVLGYGSDVLYPLYSTPVRNQPIVNLLLLTPENVPAHYCLITDLNK